MTKPDDPTPFTRKLHQAALDDPTFDWQDRQDFDFAARGLIHRPEDPGIVDAEGRFSLAKAFFDL